MTFEPVPRGSSDVGRFLAASRVLIVAGKGGVGKSTIAAALARAGCDAGVSVTLVSIDDKLPPSGVPAEIERVVVDPGRALSEYLSEHGLARISRQLVSSGITDLVAGTAPGIDDLLVLGKIKQMEREGGRDVIVVDGPAAGHALDMLRAPTLLRRAVAGGPVRSQAEDVLAMLGDASRCRVMLVCAPESTPIQEMVDTAYDLEEEIGVHLAPVVVNGIDTAPDAVLELGVEGLAGVAGQGPLLEAARHRLARVTAHRSAIDELERSFPLPHLDVPRVASSAGSIDGELTARCAAALARAIVRLGGSS
jgi:anion-transporting  ArsA/GET3 family ATPase